MAEITSVRRLSQRLFVFGLRFEIRDVLVGAATKDPLWTAGCSPRLGTGLASATIADTSGALAAADRDLCISANIASYSEESPCLSRVMGFKLWVLSIGLYLGLPTCPSGRRAKR